MGNKKREQYVLMVTPRPYLAGLLLMVFFVASTIAQASADSTNTSTDFNGHFASFKSPRDTLQAFLLATDQAIDLLRSEGKTTENIGEISQIISRLEKMFDLQDEPPNRRRDLASVTAVYLREVLARVSLPPMAEVPDEDEMFARIKEGKLAHYVIPGTPIEIIYIEEGPYARRFQFSADTVRDAKAVFQAWKEQPYVEKDVEGFYEAFLSAGPHLPNSLIRSLPGWTKDLFAGQAIWKWLFLIISTVIYIVLVLIVYTLTRRASARTNRLNMNLIFFLRPIAIIVFTRFLQYLADVELQITGKSEEYFFLVCDTIVLGAVVIFIIRIGSTIAELLPKTKYSADKNLMRLSIRICTIFVAVVIVIEGLQNIGFSLTTVIAGAGVTSLAVALAAQDALKNIFGGVMLSLDRPFTQGQRIRIKGYIGDVEEIGIRSVKIRTLTGHQVSIPNEDAARIDIENIGRRPHIRRLFNITITYDTPLKKIVRAIEILRDILSVSETDQPESPNRPNGEAHPNEAINQPNFPPRVYFDEFNADSLNILVIYWYHPGHYWDYLEHATWINVQIMEQFNAEGIEFAFPTQTVYLAEDEHRPFNAGRTMVLKEEQVNSDEIPAAKATPSNSISSLRPSSSSSGQEPQYKSDSSDIPLKDDTLLDDDSGEGGAER